MITEIKFLFDLNLIKLLLKLTYLLCYDFFIRLICIFYIFTCTFVIRFIRIVVICRFIFISDYISHTPVFEPKPYIVRLNFKYKFVFFHSSIKTASHDLAVRSRYALSL